MLWRGSWLVIKPRFTVKCSSALPLVSRQPLPWESQSTDVSALRQQPDQPKIWTVPRNRLESNWRSTINPRSWQASHFYSFSSPEPTILLACGRNRELWEQPFQACAIDADYVKPDRQNSVISFVISKWLLPELSIPTAGQKDRRLWGREWLLLLYMEHAYHKHQPKGHPRSHHYTSNVKRC